MLSSAPFFVLALAAVFAVPSGQGNRDIFWAANAYFQKPLNAAVGVAFIVTYFVLWWWTSLPGTPPRKKLQQSLRTFCSELSAVQRELTSAQSQKSFDDAESKLQSHLNNLMNWMKSDMDPSAFERFVSPSRASHSWVYSGSDGTPEFCRRRDGILDLNEARIAVLDGMTISDGWDK